MRYIVFNNIINNTIIYSIQKTILSEDQFIYISLNWSTFSKKRLCSNSV